MAGGVEMILTSSKILNISDKTDMFILSRHLFWPSKGSLWSRSINSFWYLPIADLSKDLLTHLLTYKVNNYFFLQSRNYLNFPHLLDLPGAKLRNFGATLNDRWEVRFSDRNSPNIAKWNSNRQYRWKYFLTFPEDF